METRSCLRCKEDYQPIKGPQKYCLQLKAIPCPICGVVYSSKCSAKPNRTCSKSCSSKLIRKEQSERDTANCLHCGELFFKKITSQLYCLKPRSVVCKGGCGSVVETACSKSSKMFCTPSCRQLYVRATTYSIAEKSCLICGERFTPKSSKSLICAKNHLESCRWCEKSFTIDIQDWREKNLGKYCSNICSTLGQTNSNLRRELTDEYKNIDQWAIAFKDANKRKPTAIDTHLYFGVGIPARANRDLFRIENRGRSGFEKYVVKLIGEHWSELEIVRNRRPLLSEAGGRLEIDIWLPELNLGFEVQDFATHSRTRNDEPCRLHYANVKSGPDYHKAKFEAAAKSGIELHEIWEDDIMEGRALSILQEAIRSEDDAL